MLRERVKKEKGRVPCGLLPFNAVRTAVLLVLDCVFTTNLLRSARSCSSSCCLLVRLLVCVLRGLLCRRSCCCRRCRSCFRSRSLCECCRCEETSDQNGDQFVHFVNPQHA